MTLALLMGEGRATAKSSKELPVVVHLLHFDGATGLTTQTSDGEARRLVAEANRIWRGAGISFVVAAIRKDEKRRRFKSGCRRPERVGRAEAAPIGDGR